MSQHPPSPQQSAIYSWVSSGDGNLIIQAGAGTGKTSTLMGVLERVAGSVALMAYNVPIVKELESRVAQSRQAGIIGPQTRITVKTAHGFGNSAWWRVNPNTEIADGRKKHKGAIMADRLKVPEQLREFAIKLYDQSRQAGFGLDPAKPMVKDLAPHWKELIDHYGTDACLVDADLFQVPGLVPEGDADSWEESGLQQAIALGVHHAARLVIGGAKWAMEPGGLIDFEDMIFQPLIRKAQFQQYDWVLVDECQDLNYTRLRLAQAMLRPGGRAIFVGDRNQAIYGFGGADAAAMDTIKCVFGATTLPLSVSYRCPRRVVQEAQKWVPSIEAAPEAIEGVVGRTEEMEWGIDDLTPGVDAVLCRNNAPLVKLWFRLARVGVRAQIQGSDIGAGIVALVGRWKVQTVGQLLSRLRKYEERELAKAAKQKDEARGERVADTVGIILATLGGLEPGDDVAVAVRRVNEMFDPKSKEPRVVLSSIHRSKGREWDRVWWYGAEQLSPSPWAKKGWQVEQEANLQYVAATRAKRELWMVVMEGKEAGGKRKGKGRNK